MDTLIGNKLRGYYSITKGEGCCSKYLRMVEPVFSPRGKETYNSWFICRHGYYVISSEYEEMDLTELEKLILE